MLRVKEHSSTSTVGKIEICDKISKIITLGKDEKMITMIGHVDGQSRHYDDLFRIGGESLDQLVVVDTCKSTLENNIKMHEILSKGEYAGKGTPTFIHSDVNTVLRNWDKSQKLGVIDFDGTSPANSYHAEFVSLARQLGVHHLIIVTTQRDRMCSKLRELAEQIFGTLPKVWRRAHLNKQQQLEIRGHYNKYYAPWGWNPPVGRELLKLVVLSIGFNLEFDEDYMGVGKMSAMVFKNDFR